MVGFANIREYCDATVNGQGTITSFRKSPSQITTAGKWFDLSMSPGSPSPQYYASAPLVGVPMTYSDQGGLYHGGAVSPALKYVKSLGVLSSFGTPMPCPLILCDYLLYYPFIDDGTTDDQVLTNNVPLPRYADGAGVQIMGVSVAARTGGQSFNVTYTNQDGVAGRVTSNHNQTNATAVATLINQSATASSAPQSPFLTLQAGDTGVRSIEQVNMNGVDVGLFTLVLVKPLMNLQVYDITAFCEKASITDYTGLPKIEDDAYLNLLAYPNGTMAATSLHGIFETVWN